MVLFNQPQVKFGVGTTWMKTALCLLGSSADRSWWSLRVVGLASRTDGRSEYQQQHPPVPT